MAVPHTPQRLFRAALAALAIAAALAIPGWADAAEDAGIWMQSPAAMVRMDNDLFARRGSDRDYTGGLAVSSATWGQQRWWAPDYWLGDALRDGDAGRELRALDIGVFAFTPGNLRSLQPEPGERPYAGVLALTGSRLAVDDDGRRTRSVAVTVGALGLGLTESLQKAIHRATGSELPRGYRHQVSDGGEPTGRIMVASQRLLAGGQLGTGGDVWYSWHAGAGYVTSASVALSARWGHRNLPWWAQQADLSSYSPVPSLGIVPIGTHLAMDGGLLVRVTAYNALLQGQFRHSDVRLGRRALEPVTSEAWVGISAALPSGLTLRYQVRATSSEVREGPASRAHVWGSFAVSHVF